MTTFDGAGVRSRPLPLPLPPLPLPSSLGPPMNGRLPLSRLSVNDRDDDEADDRQRRAPATIRPGRGRTGRDARPRRGDGERRHAALPASGAAPGHGPPGSRRPRGWLPDVRDVADLELERLEAAEPPARQAGDDVDPVAFVDGLGEVGAAERDAVEHVALAAEGELAVAAGGGADAGHGEAEDGDERIRVARARTARGRRARGSRA